MDANAPMQERAEQFRQAFGRVRSEVGKVIVGHPDVVDGVLTCMFVGGHALLEGVPGLGKTPQAQKLDVDDNGNVLGMEY